MRNALCLFAASGVVLALALTAWPIGRDIPPGQTLGSPTRRGRGDAEAKRLWPEGAERIANAKGRVHGYSVNMAFTELFFASDTADFNAFVGDYAVIEGIDHKVTLHIGPHKARSPWDSEDRDISVDWALTISSNQDDFETEIQVDVWLGGNIDLQKLEIPPEIEVISAGEIAVFIETHERNRDIMRHKNQARD